MFAALIAVGSYIRIPFPMCPKTLHVLFTTLAGVLLGSRKGAMSVIVFILLGLAGLPVFTGGGGISYVVQPTFGYMVGFIVGTFVTGTIVHSGKPTMQRLLVGCLSGMLIIYAIGMAYYWFISYFWLDKPIGIVPLFIYCFLILVPGDICFCILAAMLGKRLIPVLKLDQYKKKTA